jgi:hypothetical protein
MKNLKGKYIFSEWKHNEGFQQKWLRRITRQTKTQYIADVRHTLLSASNHKKLYAEKKSDFLYGIFQNCAFRMYMKGGQLFERLSYLSSNEGERKLTLIEDFSILKCKYSYNELFDTDVRKFLSSDSDMLEDMNWWKTQFEKDKDKLKVENTDFVFKFETEEVVKVDSCWYTTAEHLKTLFGVPAYHIKEHFGKMNTTHEKSIYSDTAIHYHVNHNGGDKSVLTFKENYHNDTISFWLFEDKVVFRGESGIDTW